MRSVASRVELLLAFVVALVGVVLVGSANTTPNASPTPIPRAYSYDLAAHPSHATPAASSTAPLATASTAMRGAVAVERVWSSAAKGFAAEDTASAARGLSSHGGVLSSEVNEAGGTVWTSSGAISQNDVAPLVNSGMYGGDVNVISGVHGLADGSTIVDPSLYTDDVARFGNLPGVSVHNLPDLSPAEITALLRGPGTTIGAFCDSGACLAPFR